VNQASGRNNSPSIKAHTPCAGFAQVKQVATWHTPILPKDSQGAGVGRCRNQEKSAPDGKDGSDDENPVTG
jgi:hypothetical protein